MPPALRNRTNLEDFIFATFTDDWHYLNSLHLHLRQVDQIPYERIFNDNPMDVADGVSRVETKFGMLFFDLFDNLVIKHYHDGAVKLMFYTEIKNPNKPLNFYRQLKEQLGGGWTYEQKFATFGMTEKVISLSKGKYESPKDEVLHVWNHGDFSFTLNFQLNPLRRLLFLVSRRVQKEIDRSVRAKGTLLPLLKNGINEVLSGQPEREEPHSEQGKIKFTDYYYRLKEPEFGIFELAEFKVFATHRFIGPKVHSVVTYYSRYEINTDRVVTLVDQLVAIYGTDDYGYRELALHEVDMIEHSESWTGRSWLINQHHALQNLSEPSETTVYQITLILTNNDDPDDKGLHLTVNGFNTLMEYDALMKGE